MGSMHYGWEQFHGNKEVLQVCFIDDTDLCITHNSDSTQQVIRQMQQAVTHWEGLLRAMGGMLVPEKCFWYLVNFESTNNKWKYKRSTNHWKNSFYSTAQGNKSPFNVLNLQKPAKHWEYDLPQMGIWKQN